MIFICSIPDLLLGSPPEQSDHGSSTGSSNVSPVGLPRCPSTQSISNLDARISGLMVAPAVQQDRHDDRDEEGQVHSDEEEELLGNDADDSGLQNMDVTSPRR